MGRLNKIAGTRGGRNRGDIIELEENRKAQLAVEDACVDHPEFPDCLVFARDVQIDKLDFTAKDAKLLKRKWANNRYTATGSATFHLRRKTTDRVLAPQKKKFKIKFEDRLNELGIPDLAIKEFTLR